MSFINTSIDDLKQSIYTTAQTHTGITNFNKGGVLRGLIDTIVSTMQESYDQINALYPQTNIETATGQYLTLLGLKLGVIRKPADKTKGNLTGHSYDAGTFTKGTWANIEGTELRFKCTTDVEFAANETFNIPVEAEFAGTNYNIDIGFTVKITKVIAGLESVTIEADWITDVGSEVETDESIRSRIKDKWMTVGEQNPPSKFKYIGEQVEDVREIKVIRTPRGPNSVDIIVSAINGIPSQAILDQVTDAIGSRLAICRDQLVRAPESIPVNFEITYKGDNTEDEIQLTITQYINSLLIGESLQIHLLYKAVMDNHSVNNLVITQPNNTVECAENALIIADNITITKEEE